MDFLLFTVSWMSFNVFLALIPVGTAIVIVKTKRVWTKLLLGIIWLIFLPNTIYLLTDLFHLFDDWRKTPLIISTLTIPLYILLIILGILTFVFSMYPIDYILRKKKNKKIRIGIILAVNFLVGIGLTMGRVERINSWEALTNSAKTLHSVLIIFLSSELLAVTVLFALTSNLLYFVLARNPFFSTTFRKLIK